MDVPYTVERRRETGLYNGELGMWLFLASEVMLFAALIAAYLLLRLSAESWPVAAEQLNVPLGALNSVLLLASSVTIVWAWTAFLRDNETAGRRRLALTAGLGAIFLAIKGFEWFEKLSHGVSPATDLFYGLYFVMTGVHALHLVAGVAVVVFHSAFGRSLAPGQLAHRVEVTALYWHFVDVVWLVIFPLFYLL